MLTYILLIIAAVIAAILIYAAMKPNTFSRRPTSRLCPTSFMSAITGWDWSSRTVPRTSSTPAPMSPRKCSIT